MTAGRCRTQLDEAAVVSSFVFISRSFANIEDITRWREYIDFIFEKIKSISASRRVIFFYHIDKRSLAIFNRFEAGNDVIDIFTSEAWKICHSGPGCGLWSRMWSLVPNVVSYEFYVGIFPKSIAVTLFVFS